MLRSKSLALYKGRPVFIVDIGERIQIKLEDGQTQGVRDKDLVFLHPGPVDRMPEPAGGGDFVTARQMLLAECGDSGATQPLDWGEFAELVFGSSGPAQVLACWKEAAEGRLFRLDEGKARPLSEADCAKEAERRARKASQASERALFVNKARLIMSRGKAKGGEAPGEAAGRSLFGPEDDRFLGDIEAQAFGKSPKNRIAQDIGLNESPEAAHAFLLKAGLWDESKNPHARRQDCALGPPRLELAPGVDSMGDDELRRRLGFGREDLSTLESWAIDNAWSKDPDDAIAWDGEAVWVHVADPASIVLPGSDADKEALGRGSTLYLPELIAPMLPDRALRLFGLGLEENSPALSIKIKLNPDASVASTEIFGSMVRVCRASYAQADALLDSDPGLAALRELAERRARRRREAGAVDIEIPELRVHVQEDGRIELCPLSPSPSSAMVREMMLLAGEAAARWAFERALAFPYLSQEAPSGTLGDSSEEGADRREGLAAQFAKRRRMRAGVSGPTPSAHWGMGLSFYSQVTSPLRRYQDLLAHHQIRAILAGEKALDAEELGRRCAQAQAAGAAARQAERASILHWSLAWLVRNPDWRGEGVIIGGPGQGGSWQVFIPALGLETRLGLGPGRKADDSLKLRLLRVDLPKLEACFDELR